MKTFDYLRQYVPVLTISLVLIASVISVNAQNDQNGDHRKKERDHGRNEYRNDNRLADNEQIGKKGWDHHNGNAESREGRNDYRPHYYQKHYHAQPNYYDHPRYGRVYHRFEHNPIVFENRFGDYYYYGNSFYQYREGLGYCIVEPPRHVFFRHLPLDCERVYINGKVLFRNGDLFFEFSPRGYVLMPSPIEIRFSARF